MQNRGDFHTFTFHVSLMYYPLNLCIKLDNAKNNNALPWI